MVSPLSVLPYSGRPSRDFGSGVRGGEGEKEGTRGPLGRPEPGRFPHLFYNAVWAAHHLFFVRTIRVREQLLSALPARLSDRLYSEVEPVEF